MKKTLSVFRHTDFLSSVIFALLIFAFFALWGVSDLSFQEQYQLFLFTPSYFCSRLAAPGGLSDYIAEFITQFNYLYVLGALLTALLFWTFQQLTACLCRQNGMRKGWYPLTFIPALAMLWYMSDVHVLPSFLISLIAVMALMVLYCRLSTRTARVIFMVLSQSVGYWLFGPVTLMLVFYGLFRDFHSLLFYLFTFIYAVAVILIIAQFRPEPLYRLFGGLNYYRYPAYVPLGQIFMMILVTVWPVVVSLLQETRKIWVVLLEYMVFLFGGAAVILYSYNNLEHQMVEYDYLVRVHAWDKIISKAEKQQPTTPLGVSCVNFALSQQGQLCDRLFEFYQNGEEGLFPPFTRDMLSPVSTGEIFYSLGMVNDAERYMFEAQQAIPNFRRSGRLEQRIIACEIINGHYAVAEKLLHELQHTLFYSAWANRQLALLGHENLINADPVYGKLRRYRVTKDYLFSDTEMDQMLGLLFSHCHENKNAYEYLMVCELVNRNMQKFMAYYPIGRFAGYTDHIPYAIQQGLLYDWTQKHNSFDGMPYSIDPQWQQAMAQFIETYMRNKKDPSLITPPLGNTFWSYMLVKVQPRPEKEKSKAIY